MNKSARATCAGVAVSTTCTSKAKKPAFVGVPEMRPVGLSTSPAGSAPPEMDHVRVPATPPTDVSGAE